MFGVQPFFHKIKESGPRKARPVSHDGNGSDVVFFSAKFSQVRMAEYYKIHQNTTSNYPPQDGSCFAGPHVSHFTVSHQAVIAGTPPARGEAKKAKGGLRLV